MMSSVIVTVSSWYNSQIQQDCDEQNPSSRLSGAKDKNVFTLLGLGRCVVVGRIVTHINWRQFITIGILVKQLGAQEVQNNMHRKYETLHNSNVERFQSDDAKPIKSNPCFPKRRRV